MARRLFAENIGNIKTISIIIIRDLTTSREGLLSVRCATGNSSSPLVTADDVFDAKVFRHNLTRSDNSNRKGYEHKETLELMNQEYTSAAKITRLDTTLGHLVKFGFFFVIPMILSTHLI
ncbi:putative 4-hydroxy-3-methylbut-2-enyl diphosphate reductase [Helianthus anomalus]